MSGSLNGPFLVPQHLALIMDGNGRWAQLRSKSFETGHSEGVKTLLKLFPYLAESGIPVISLFAFSIENWKRSFEEISSLIDLLKKVILEKASLFEKYQIAFKWIGEEQGLSSNLIQLIRDFERKTKHYKKTKVNFAFNYSGQQDILNGVKKIVKCFDPSHFDEQKFRLCLSTHKDPDVDMLVRTGGEKRLSNFLLWQMAYAELYFIDTLWPDLTVDQLKELIRNFGTRERRFGGRPFDATLDHEEVLNA